MEPTRQICRDLFRFHRRARLGWDGAAQAFGLIQLFHKHDAERTMREPWDHGPIFSRAGRPGHLDYDPLVYFPFYLARLDARARHPYGNEKDAKGEPVFYDPKIHGWGYLLKLVKQWVRPMAARSYHSALQKGREVERFVNDMAFDMAERIYRTGQRGSAGAPISARKFGSSTANLDRLRDGGLDFTEKSLPPTPPGGWEKHIANDKAGVGDPDNLGSIGRI